MTHTGSGGRWELYPNLFTIFLEWFILVTNSHMNCMLFFTIENFGKEIVPSFSLKAKKEKM